MANNCQLCVGEPRVAVEDWRSVWLGIPDGFYLEWGRCCNDADLKEKLGEYPVLVHAETGEEQVLHTAQELWALIAKPENVDTYGTAIWV